MNELRGPFTTRSISVSLSVQLLSDLRHRQSTALRWLPPQLLHPLDESPFRREVAIGFDAFDTFATASFSLPGGSQFENKDVLLELCYRAYEATLVADLDADLLWRNFLLAWRNDLTATLAALPPKAPQSQRTALQWSLSLIHEGFGIAPPTLPIRDLSSTHVGRLMAIAGYHTQGEGLRGERGWRGSLPVVEARIKILTAQRDAAMARLNALLASDTERAQMDTAAKSERDALASMSIQNNERGDGLCASTLDGDPLPVEAMTIQQRSAFERFQAAAFPSKEPVSS